LKREEIDLGSKTSSAMDALTKKIARRTLQNAVFAEKEILADKFGLTNWDTEITLGNPEEGKILFTSRGCIACHIDPVSGQGGSLGPSLLNAGERFTPTYLAESVLFPSRSISPNFQSIQITLEDKTILSGYVEFENKNVLALRIFTGKLREISKDKIKHREVNTLSMMPVGLVQTPQEIRDLVAFMASLKGPN